MCIEATGNYWIPVYNILEEHQRIYLAHPKYLIAIRELRDLTQYHYKLTNFYSSEANWLQNSLTVSTITRSSVLSDVLGVSGSRIIDNILEMSSHEIDLPALIHGSLNKKLSRLELAIDSKIIKE